MLRHRPFFSLIKLASFGLLSVLYFTNSLLNEHFPYPEAKEGIPIETVEAAQSKIKILHQLVYWGVAAVGMLAIYSNGKMFVDNATIDV